jgi:ATP-dependent Lon protease
MDASITFEQSYGGIDGDSASSTEIYAILSSLSGIPIRQDIAVTGSVNQKGEIQPIGGVNLKIEGFYDVCKARGLTGRQGVIIPIQNVDDLMLREEVYDAVQKKQFQIYAIKTIDEGMEILTGVKAGKQKPDHTFELGTVNAFADRKLQRYADDWKRYEGKN